uniref:Solute carrier family 4 member 1a (Diego blood group) n=1 Tax=Astyanax mexicanus TaxID=7994 RepID=A0A8B9JG27_ASTMX
TNATTRGDSQAYVELNELLGNKWQETGRWVGYEESYNPITGAWGPSHVSYLTFKSLIQLRKVMTTGAVLLDVEESGLSGIAERIVNELLDRKEIRPSDRDTLLKTLLQKRSQTEGASTTTTGIDMIEMLHTYSVTKQRDAADSVEASIVLSGVLDSLQKPVVAFMRLRDAIVMDGILESNVPVRFIFALVGPTQSGMNFHESGRAMATLLADWVFSLEAFLAQNEKELTNAIADFMDCSIVIPPTEIQSVAMLQPIIGFQKRMLRERLRPADTRITLGQKIKGPEKPQEDPLARTGYPFGGMVKDIKRRYRHYISDFTDALNPQVLSAVIFIYFAALSPAITFGGLLALLRFQQRKLTCSFTLSMCTTRSFIRTAMLFYFVFYIYCSFKSWVRVLLRVHVCLEQDSNERLTVDSCLGSFQTVALIVSKPERKMVKGSGFHFDLLLLVAMGGAASIFGVPWLSAATVRSVTHVNALTVMTKGPKPEIEKVLEQRISGILVAVLVGEFWCTIYFLDILNLKDFSMYPFFLTESYIQDLCKWEHLLLLDHMESIINCVNWFLQIFTLYIILVLDEEPGMDVYDESPFP